MKSCVHQMKCSYFIRDQKHLNLLIVVLSVLLVSGCASVISKHSRTILMNSEGDRQECTIDFLQTQMSKQRYDECIKSYEEEGYKIWGQY